jgi:formate hydrogenlyase subunit 5
MALPRVQQQPPLSVDIDRWRRDVLTEFAAGARLAGLYGSGTDNGCILTAILVGESSVYPRRVLLAPDSRGRLSYPALTPELPAAFWYERALHDLSGVIADGHPRLEPLLLDVEHATRPRPGAAAAADVDIRDLSAPVDVAGDGLFTLPFGPVRSGVMETIEFLIETPGEDIPHLNIRPHYKHRGVAKAFEGRSVADGVLVAERVEGISSVAHALAYCHAIEQLAGVDVPTRAALLRTLHAELERIANHLDVTMRLADAAGLAVATARFGFHKETVLRTVSALCGNRFGRGVLTPGGAVAKPLTDPTSLRRKARRLQHAIASDVQALERSASFVDRLRTTGPLDPALARSHGALGPIGRGSGFDDDHRWNASRSYDAYPLLPQLPAPRVDAGDALARARVRWAETDNSFALVDAAIDRLAGAADGPWAAAVPPADGFGLGWAESAQGEVVYAVEAAGGRIKRCLARAASFHNLVLLHDVFRTDIFTDFPFIEASFGLCYAGVAM